MGARFHRGLIRLRRWTGFLPLTPAGLLLLAAALSALYFRGYQRLDLVALATGVSIFAVWSLTAMSVVCSFFWYRSRVAKLTPPSSLDLVSGREVSSGFAVPIWRFLPLIQLRWEAVGLDAETAVIFQQGRQREFVRCHRRCLHFSQSRRFTVSDTLGLSSMSWELTTGESVRVLPHPGRLGKPEILLSLISGDDISDPRGDPTGDRVDMRQYQHGDPMKFILWKVYSRTGRVMVRVPERALAARPRACCYLLSGPDDEATAAVARVLLEQRLLGEAWRFGADGREGHAVTVEEALNRVAESGNTTALNSTGLEQFMQQAEGEGFGFCLVLSPPGDTAYASRIIDLCDRCGMHCRIWIGFDIEQFSDSFGQRLVRRLSQSRPQPDEIARTWQGRASLVERASGTVMARSSS